jgi:hypothetical protein
MEAPMVRTVLLLAAILCAAFAAQSAAAATQVSGTYFTHQDSGVADCTFKGPPTAPFVGICHTTGFLSDYSGSLTGVSVANFTSIINCKTGRAIGQGTETFTGSLGVGGPSGTLTWAIRFTSAFDCTTFGVSGFSGSAGITSGTGALAGLHGSIQFGDTTYNGNLT